MGDEGRRPVVVDKTGDLRRAREMSVGMEEGMLHRSFRASLVAARCGSLLLAVCRFVRNRPTIQKTSFSWTSRLGERCPHSLC